MQNSEVIELFRAHQVIMGHKLAGEPGRIGAEKLAIARNLRLLMETAREIETAVNSIDDGDGDKKKQVTAIMGAAATNGGPKLRRLDYVILNFSENPATCADVLAVLLPILDNVPD
jgi:hypothetical protein